MERRSYQPPSSVGYEKAKTQDIEKDTTHVQKGLPLISPSFATPVEVSSPQSDVPITTERPSVPVGQWRDGLCDCCTYGCCHPLLWNAWCCPLIAVAQIMTRLRLNLFAEPTGEHQSKQTFPYIFRVVVTYWVFYFMAYIMFFDGLQDYATRQEFDPSAPPPPSYWMAIAFMRLLQMFGFALAIYTIVIMTKLRMRLRESYGIPPCCGGCLGDCCTVYWCHCCAVSQMARHTADYDRYIGVCCSPTGLPPDAPEIV